MNSPNGPSGSRTPGRISPSITISAAAGTWRSMVVQGETSSGSPSSPPTTSNLPTSGGRVGERAHRDERVHAEDDRARQRLPQCLGAALVLEHPPPRVQAHAHPVAPLHLEAVVALRLHARLGVARHQHARGEVAAGVAGEVGGDGQPGQVDVGAGEHALAEGRVGDDHRLDRVLDPPRVLERPAAPPARRGRRPAPGGSPPRCRRSACRRPARAREQDGEAAPALVLQHQRHHVEARSRPAR